MNEEQKNIETCLAENILDEVANVPTDAQFRSLVEESFDPLQQQALQQAGYDGYKEVMMYHQPYTFTSQVAQMKSNLILLLRRLWRFPFGRGTIRSLADMWQHYITRLKGNPEYGIPSRLDQLTDLQDAPAILADRDMSSGIRFGETSLPDGMSLINFLCSDKDLTSSPIDIIDTNKGWTWNKSLPSLFPIRKLVLGCKYRKDSKRTMNLPYLQSMKFPELVDINFSTVGYPIEGIFDNLPVLTELDMPKLEVVTVNGYGSIISNMPLIRVLTLPSFREWKPKSEGGILYNMAGLEELYLPEFRYCGGGLVGSESFVLDCPELWKVVVGYGAFDTGTLTTILPRCPKVTHFEFINEVSSSQKLVGWNPSYILSDNPTGTDLIEEGSTATNNLQQFLSNFKTYIAERLTDNGTGLTLTLSQEVRDAIHAAEDEYGIENIIITQKGWTISPAPNE